VSNSSWTTELYAQEWSLLGLTILNVRDSIIGECKLRTARRGYIFRVRSCSPRKVAQICALCMREAAAILSQPDRATRHLNWLVTVKVHRISGRHGHACANLQTWSIQSHSSSGAQPRNPAHNSTRTPCTAVFHRSDFSHSKCLLAYSSLSALISLLFSHPPTPPRTHGKRRTREHVNDNPCELRNG
jgi:hypothetical protein